MRLLQQFIDQIASGKVFTKGPMPNWALMLVALGPGIVHAVMLRTYMDLMLSRKNTTGTVRSVTWASQMGKEINQIASYRTAKAMNKDEWKKQSRFFKNWSVKRCKAFTARTKSKLPMTTKQARKVGQAMVEIALKSDLFTSKTIVKGKYTRIKRILIDEEVLKKLESLVQEADIKYIRYKPMICPPAPWSTTELGGYYFGPFRKRIRNNSKVSEPYCKALNTLQSQEWEIDREILAIMRAVYENGSGIGFIPSKGFEKCDIEPYPASGSPVEQKEWIRRKERVWHDWATAQADRQKMEARFRFAALYKNTFFHAWFPCFRGRLYTCCELLTPQGSSIDRALLRFSVPQKLTEAGKTELKRGVAAAWDRDKDTLDARVAWVDANLSMLKSVANDPLTDRRWFYGNKKRNKSWERLALTRELFREDGMTQIPIQLDGSNNGLQHWAAILRAQDLGKSVNLTYSKTPQDIYADLARVVHKELMAKPIVDTVDQMLHDHYKQSIDRNLTKRPVMCFGYGITQHSVLKYTYADGALDWIQDDKIRRIAAKRLGMIIWQCMNQYLTKAARGKEWLSEEVYNTVKATNAPWKYTNPLGFEMIHSYPKTIPVVSRVKVWNTSNHEMVFRDPSSTQDPLGNSTAASPNLIHSLDSCHAVLTINKMQELGLDGYSFIHDSFGTYANNIPKLREIIKETFVELHTKFTLNDVYQQLSSTVPAINHNLPPSPDPSDLLDISEVMESEYFFA